MFVQLDHDAGDREGVQGEHVTCWAPNSPSTNAELAPSVSALKKFFLDGYEVILTSQLQTMLKELAFFQRSKWSPSVTLPWRAPVLSVEEQSQSPASAAGRPGDPGPVLGS